MIYKSAALGSGITPFVLQECLESLGSVVALVTYSRQAQVFELQANPNGLLVGFNNRCVVGSASAKSVTAFHVAIKIFLML